jgi:hypothetical protein
VTAPEATPARRLWNRHIRITYGTAAAGLLVILALLTVVLVTVFSTFQRVDDLKTQNNCRAQFAEAERRATLDVVSGLGDVFVIATENREQVATYIANYRERVNAANRILGTDVEKTCT